MSHDHDDHDDDGFPPSETTGLALDERRPPRPEGPREPRRRRTSYTRLSKERPPRITDYDAGDLVKATEAARIVGITRDAFVHRARNGQIPNEGRNELGHRMFNAHKMWTLRRKLRASESAPPSRPVPSVSGAYPSSTIAALIADGEVDAQIFKQLKQGASRADVTFELSLHPDVVAHHADGAYPHLRHRRRRPTTPPCPRNAPERFGDQKKRRLRKVAPFRSLDIRGSDSPRLEAKANAIETFSKRRRSRGSSAMREPRFV